MLVTATRTLFIGSILMCILVANPAAAACPGQQFAGVIDFTTRVTGAKSASAIGVNGYYRMKVTVDAACNLRAELVKLGFNKIFFKREQLQWGVFTPRVYAVPTTGGSAAVMMVDASLSSERGKTLDIAVSLVKFDNGWQDNHGPGFWRHLGASWNDAGMWGALQWQFSTLEQPLASPMKPKCDSVVLGQGEKSIPAFQCDGLIIANNTLSAALYSAPSGAPGAEPSFDRIANTGYFATGGAWWDICVHSESDNPENPGPMAMRLVWVGNEGIQEGVMDADAASWKRCGARPPKAARPEAPRWQGGIR